MERDFDKHLPILAWLHVAMGGLFILSGLFVLVFFGGIGLASGEREAFAILAVIGAAVAFFLFLVGLPGILAGWGLLNRRLWARTLAIILGILNLVNVPLGTALGAYTLWLLWDDDALEAFD